MNLDGVSTANDNETIDAYMMVPPVDLTGKNVTIKVISNNSKIYSVNLGGINFEEGHLINLVQSMSFAGNTYSSVDLGLPSGTLWATMNIGANNPSEVGSYFAWGETTPRTLYDVFDYKYINNDHKYTKYTYEIYYGPTDGKSILEPIDDAASVNWQGDWRMPTKAEIRELIDNCTWTQTTGGFTVTGPNGNSIFLPLDSNGIGHDNDNYLWTSSLQTNPNPNCGQYFGYYYGHVNPGGGGRNYVVPIRPVRK